MSDVSQSPHWLQIEETCTTNMDYSSNKHIVRKGQLYKHGEEDDNLTEKNSINSSPGLSSLLAYLDETEQESQNISLHSPLSKGNKHCKQTVMEVKTSTVGSDVSIKYEKQEKKAYIWDDWEDENVSMLPAHHEDETSKLSSYSDALHVEIKMDNFSSIDETVKSLQHPERGISHKPINQNKYSEFYSVKCETIKERVKSMREELSERIKEARILQTKFNRTKVANQQKINRFNGLWTSKFKDKEINFEKVRSQRFILCWLTIHSLSEPNNRVLLRHHLNELNQHTDMYPQF